MSAQIQKAGAYQTVLIEGGLDLISPKVGINPGSTSDCQNYEVAITEGLKRIDGFERYDGGVSPSFYRSFKIQCEFDADLSASFPIGQAITLQSGPYQGKYDGWVVNKQTGIAGDRFYLWIVFRSVDAAYAAETLYPVGPAISQGIFTYPDSTVTEVSYAFGYVPENSSAATVSADLTARDVAYAVARPTIQEVPGQGSVLGLFWFRDALYAARDYVTIKVTGGSQEPDPGDSLYQDIVSPSPSGKVAKVVTISGSWGITDDAVAYIMLYDVTDDFIAGVAIKSLAKGSVQIATVDSIDEDAQAAGLYKAEGERGTIALGTYSWQHQDLGWNVAYTNGSADFVVLNRSLKEADITSLIQQTTWHYSTTTLNVGGWGPSPVTTISDVVSEDPPDFDATYARKVWFAGAAPSAFSIGGFGFDDDDIPPAAYITGLEIEVMKRGRTTGTRAVPITDYGCGFLGLDNDTGISFGELSPWNHSTIDPDVTNWATITYGGPQILFGLTNVTPAKLKEASFGIRFGAQFGTASGAGNAEARVSNIRIKVHYLPQTSKIYFWDGTTAVVAEVVMAYRQSGTVAGGDATGMLYLTSVGTNRRIGATEQIRTYPTTPGTTPDGGATDGSTLIANTTAAAEKNVMDWTALLDSTSSTDQSRPSKYQYVTHNFYASSGLEAMYVVSGGGPAAMFDGTNFSRILTGYTQTAEKPRHVVAHQGRLFLGYQSGTVQYSDGTSPLSFDGTLAANIRAGELGFGSPITGLYSLNGDSLAVFTRNDTQMIQGNISDAPYQSMIQPKLGAIEYSAQSMGQFLYTTSRGIISLDAVLEYGDFRPSPHSAVVWPYLRPRVQQSSFFESAPTGVINSLAVKNKAQYRLMFADGYVLTATFLRDGELPRYTLQYYTNADGNPLTWDVLCSGTESLGRDRLFGATNDGTGLVYELDRGNSFDGAAISAYFVLSVDDQKLPYQKKFYRDMHVHGTAQDYATFTMSRAADYNDPTTSVAIPFTFGASTAAPTGTIKPFFSQNVMQKEGRAIAFRFDSSSASQFPHTIQAISVYVTPLAEQAK